MPFLRITVHGSPAHGSPAHGSPVPSEADARLAAEATALVARTLGKRPEVTAVLVERPPALWSVGATPVAAAANLEVRITAGTNTAAQKAAFVADAMAMLRRHLGGLPAATYVTVQETPATDWGYDGRTQADRAGAGPAGPAA